MKLQTIAAAVIACALLAVVLSSSNLIPSLKSGLPSAQSGIAIANSDQLDGLTIRLHERWQPMKADHSGWAHRHMMDIGPRTATDRAVEGFVCPANSGCNGQAKLVLMTGKLKSDGRDLRDLDNEQMTGAVVDLAAHHCKSNATLKSRLITTKSDVRTVRTMCQGRNEQQKMVFWATDWVLWKDRFLMIHVVTGAPLEDIVDFTLDRLVGELVIM
ncbi:MAG: hypothetical protein HOP09_10900 [Hyphomicrobium sp.]|nr:hypothetical protein [Hyphomicrobium sp.]